MTIVSIICRILSDKALAFCAMREHFVAVRYRWISDIRSPSWAFPPETWAALRAASFFVDGQDYSAARLKG